MLTFLAGAAAAVAALVYVRVGRRSRRAAGARHRVVAGQVVTSSTVPVPALGRDPEDGAVHGGF